MTLQSHTNLFLTKFSDIGLIFGGIKFQKDLIQFFGVYNSGLKL